MEFVKLLNIDNNKEIPSTFFTIFCCANKVATSHLYINYNSGPGISAITAASVIRPLICPLKPRAHDSFALASIGKPIQAPSVSDCQRILTNSTENNWVLLCWLWYLSSAMPSLWSRFNILCPLMMLKFRVRFGPRNNLFSPCSETVTKLVGARV